MKRQTKLVAVLSTAALLAIGASMTSFAAAGWSEEGGIWSYYDGNGSKVTDRWEKSGDNWYYLDSDGNMATDQLIDDGDNSYYVDSNGVMASNQWVAIDNANSDEDNEPEHYWYYFQANGKALTNGNNVSVALKTVNGKKYAFDSDGKMLYGWVNQDSAERIDNTSDEAFKDGDYYFGSEDDGAMTVGWLQTDITYYDAADDSLYKQIAPVFADDWNQTRWFYFMANGKKVQAKPNDGTKQKTINGKKYSFDENGAMVAEWSRNIKTATQSSPGHADWSGSWRYYNSVDDGARATRGWFKVVPAELLEPKKYNSDDSAWYYADGKGNIYANKFKTIRGKEYAFDKNGRMISGLKMIRRNGSTISDVKGGDDVRGFEIDTEDGFNAHAGNFAAAGYGCYYFGDGSDGAMKTGSASADIDGDKFRFSFQKVGGHKGAGKIGEDDKKLYNSGKLVTADKDMKYQVVKDQSDEVIDSTADIGDSYTGYSMYDDASALPSGHLISYTDLKDNASFAHLSSLWGGITLSEFKQQTGLSYNDKYDQIKVYVIDHAGPAGSNTRIFDHLGLPNSYKVVNTSGNVSKKNDKVKDGNNVYYKLYNGKIICTYITE